MVKERKDKKAGAKKTKTDFCRQEEDATSSPMPTLATPTSEPCVPAAGSSPSLLLGDNELEMLEVCPPSDYIPGQGSRHVLISHNHIICNSRSIYAHRDLSCNVVIHLGHTFKTGRGSLRLYHDIMRPSHNIIIES